MKCGDVLEFLIKKEGLNNVLKDEFYGFLHPKLTRPLGLNIFYCIYLRTYTKGLNTSSDKLRRSHPICKPFDLYTYKDTYITTYDSLDI